MTSTSVPLDRKLGTHTRRTAAPLGPVMGRKGIGGTAAQHKHVGSN